MTSRADSVVGCTSQACTARGRATGTACAWSPAGEVDDIHFSVSRQLGVGRPESLEVALDRSPSRQASLLRPAPSGARTEGGPQLLVDLALLFSAVAVVVVVQAGDGQHAGPDSPVAAGHPGWRYCSSGPPPTRRPESGSVTS